LAIKAYTEMINPRYKERFPTIYILAPACLI
jgi:hypothetical protein